MGLHRVGSWWLNLCSYSSIPLHQLLTRCIQIMIPMENICLALLMSLVKRMNISPATIAIQRWWSCLSIHHSLLLRILKICPCWFVHPPQNSSHNIRSHKVRGNWQQWDILSQNVAIVQSSYLAIRSRSFFPSLTMCKGPSLAPWSMFW